MRTVFGPVASRRLGLSLGVDLVPAKTCNFDCVYCECGPTTDLVSRPGNYRSAAEILPELTKVLKEQGSRLDFVTLSGAGEPTLNNDLAEIVAEIKRLSPAKVGAITNSTLLGREEVVRALAEVDVLMPSLDSAVPETFARINRPHPDISLDSILEGLYGLKARVRAEVWLEILLIAGLNDTPTEIEALRLAAEKIDPDRVQLNSIHRPPVEKQLRPVARTELDRLATVFGSRAEVIARPPKRFIPGQAIELEAGILELIDRRPSTLEDLVTALGRQKAELEGCLSGLVGSGRVVGEQMGEEYFYRGIAEEGKR